MWRKLATFTASLCAAAIAGSAMSAGAAPLSRHCRVVAAAKLPAEAGGAASICSEIERAMGAAVPNVRYKVEVRVVTPARLSARMVVEPSTSQSWSACRVTLRNGSTRNRRARSASRGGSRRMSAICAGRRVSQGGGEPSGHCAHARLATKQIANTGVKTRVRFTRRTYYRWRSLGTNATDPDGSRRLGFEMRGHFGGSPAAFPGSAGVATSCRAEGRAGGAVGRDRELNQSRDVGVPLPHSSACRVGARDVRDGNGARRAEVSF